MDSMLGSLSLDESQNFAHSTPSKDPLNQADDDLILGKTSKLSINDEDSDGDVKMKDVPLAKQLLSKSFKALPRQPHTPIRSSPLKESYHVIDSPTSQDNDFLSDEENLVDDSDIAMSGDDHNHSFTYTISKTAHNIFSPTELGARIATSPSPFKANLREKLDQANESIDDSVLSEVSSGDHADLEDSDDQGLRNRNHNSKTPSKLSVVRYEPENDTTQDSEETTFDDSTQNMHPQPYRTPVVRTPWGNSPIQLQMHHHHYYPPSSDSTPAQYTPGNRVIPLPAPWSKFASPKAPAPYLISSYLQLLFNVITSSITIYILINAIKTVKSDINLKMEEYASEIAMEVSRCARSYVENKCAPDTRVAALEAQCSEWERCMNRDPTTQAGKASVSAETLGVILNSLIEPIGIKAIIVFGVGLISWAFTSNFIFGFVRAKSYYGWDSNTQDQHQQPYQQLGWSQQQPQDYTPSTPALLPSGPPQQFMTPGGPTNWDYNFKQ